MTCSACGQDFKVRVVHSGFSNDEFLYCDRSHHVAVLEIYSRTSSLLLRLADECGRGLWDWRESAEYRARIEGALRSCPCGGRFTFSAGPRCPRCRVPLALDEVRAQVELFGNAGWRGAYYLILDDGSVEEPFLEGQLGT